MVERQVTGSNEGSYEARRSALPDVVEVRVRSERRRRWSPEDKLAVVRETLVSGTVVQVIADRHGIGTGLLYTWRKQMLRAAMTGFAAVEVRPEALPAPETTDDGATAQEVAQSQPVAPSSARVAAAPALLGLIEVALPSGVRLRVGSDVDGPALRRVLAALAGP